MPCYLASFLRRLHVRKRRHRHQTLHADERESFKRKEAAAKKFDNRLDNFRKSAQALRDAARQLEEDSVVVVM